MTATTYQEAVALAIPASNQIHDVVNGAADETVEIEDGSTIPTIRKALADSILFDSTVIDWAEGTTVNTTTVLYNFEGQIYWAPTASASKTVVQGTTPIGDTNWNIAPVNTSTLGSIVAEWSTGYVVEDSTHLFSFEGNIWWAPEASESNPITLGTTPVGSDDWHYVVFSKNVNSPRGVPIVFEESGTYTPSDGCVAFRATLVAGGGSSGPIEQTAEGEAAASTGGSGGGYSQKLFTTVEDSYQITVGKGGEAVSSGDFGNEGGDSSILRYGEGVVVTGGEVGFTGVATSGNLITTGNTGGSVYTSSHGDINIRGGSSTESIIVGGFPAQLSYGGATPLGIGINAGNDFIKSYGKGGDGVYAVDLNFATTGKAGHDGVVIIEEFFTTVI